MSSESKRPQRRPLRVELLEQRELLAGDTYLVNFQNDEGTTPTGYLRDSGNLFGDRGGGYSYGWSSDHTDQGRERSVLADQRLDTLIHIEARQDWEFALANGAYEVTVAVGDPGNDHGLHTVNVEGVSFFSAVQDGAGPMFATAEVTVADGRLTLDSGAAANMATRIDFIHIVGIPSTPNAVPSAPNVTEPAFDGQEVNPADVHMEAVGYFDPDSDAHKSTDWEIWTTGGGAEPVWQTLGIEGVERLHTHLGDGIFINSHAGQIELNANTQYELRVRYRDDAGSVSSYASRLFQTGAASSTFALQLEDIPATPAPVWTSTLGTPIELPVGDSFLSPGDAIIAFDFDAGTDSESPNGEQAVDVLDGDPGTKYLNFGKLLTGFIVTPTSASAVKSLVLTTANDAAARDPASYVLYGTNDAISATPHGSGREQNWTEISSGALSLPDARQTIGAAVSFANDTVYSSYKLIFPTVKNEGAANSMQVADAQFFAQSGGAGPGVLSAGDAILPVQDIASTFTSDSAPGEEVDKAIDGDAGTKYINHGRERSGFIITPEVGATTISGFRMTTANDAPERDPSAWALYGTNEAIQSVDGGFGDGENWTLIDSGEINLPLERFTQGGDVAVDNTLGAFTSYRMVITEVRDVNAANSMQFSEVEFFGGETAGLPPKLSIEAGSTGSPFLQIEGSDLPGNLVTDFPEMANHATVRIVITAGDRPLSLTRSDLTIGDGAGGERTLFLPAVDLAAGERLDLWVSSAGGTYYGTEGQTTPDFSLLARSAELDIPFVSSQPGFVVEQVGEGYRLPVNIAFVPNPGPNPDDPLYFVTELYGSIQVVTRDGTKHEFATGLLDYNPQGPISGSGEQGLTGIAVQRDELDPEVYHLYVGMLWDNGSPAGGASHYPKVERIDSVAGGLSMDSRTVLLNMQPETQGQSHQISNVSIGPDGKLYVHVGDGFDASTAQDLNQFRGKILRMETDGSPATDNPFYNAGDGISPTDYVYAYGFRNPFGGAWRASDGKHYEVENGPSVDRFAQVNEGVNYGWDGSNASMQTFAIYNWAPSTAPVNITFVQPETFNGSQFPASFQDMAFIGESGPTYAAGPQANGKRVTQFELDANGDLVDGPNTLVEYVGVGRSSVVALAAGHDGLYFSELYEDTGEGGATGPGARIYRIRYVNQLAGDYDIDGDVDQDDYTVWRSTYGSNLLLAADGNGDGVVNAADYTVWRDNIGAALPAPSPAESPIAVATDSLAADQSEPAPDDSLLTNAVFAAFSPEATPQSSASSALDSLAANGGSDATGRDAQVQAIEGLARGRRPMRPAWTLELSPASETEQDATAADRDAAFAGLRRPTQSPLSPRR
ncbi:Soluble aldose sugar dehydrogenase YliI precursor [Posidoniimonas polymericola]|uniref:Soluble aldose sugar dehydrogenase YliI n=1 Tax=Posidoniimonas polymericola TaxID=2528002 RepID=A0A5C5ZG88_9BACT|nr:PQQ-dependent sugar dehydrogenase [Posidoniimonas polymericola]TWT85891.1 Soluble aldose sugar dehydrogenase YliI precursor [Posidoniimonas polymericola]